MKLKFTPEITRFLKSTYVEEVEAFGGPAKITKQFNSEFFKKMRGTEALEGFTEHQMRGSLIISGVYVATAPRVEPKKAGKCKADLLAEFSTLAGVELTSGMKLTMVDIEALISAWPKGKTNGDFDVEGTPVE